MPRPVRLAFVQAALPIGGAERLIQSLALGLPRERVEPVAIHLYAPGPIGFALQAGGIPTTSGLARGPWDPGVGRRLAQAYQQHAVDVVYVTDSALPLFWSGRLRRRAARPALVVGFHSTGKHEDFLQHRLANGAALPVADRLVALAGSHRDFLCRTLHLDPRRFAVIPNGVDAARFTPAADRDAARRAAGLPLGVPLAGIVAALRPEKNHGLFLRAAARVRERLPQARFVVVGDGPQRDPLHREVESLGLGDAVLFLGAREDVPAVMRALDVAVLSSKPVIETFPVTLLEAQASGIPVVSTDVGSVRDLVGDGATGYLVPPGEVGPLADRIAQLLGDPGLRARLGTAGRACVERAFTLPRMIEAYADLVEDVAAKAGSGR